MKQIIGHMIPNLKICVDDTAVVEAFLEAALYPAAWIKKKKVIYYFTGGLFYPMVSLGSCPWAQISLSHASNIPLEIIWNACIQQNSNNNKNITRRQNKSVQITVKSKYFLFKMKISKLKEGGNMRFNL